MAVPWKPEWTVRIFILIQLQYTIIFLPPGKIALT